MKTILFILIASFLTVAHAEMHHHMDSMHQHSMQHAMPDDKSALSFPPGCNAQEKICFLTTDWDSQKISLSASFSSKITALRPFKLKLSVRGIQLSELEQIKVSYTMPGMNMGKNEVVFKRIPAKTKDGSLVFEANSMVPMCPSGDSDWNAMIDLNAKNDQRLSINLPFTLKSH